MRCFQWDGAIGTDSRTMYRKNVNSLTGRNNEQTPICCHGRRTCHRSHRCRLQEHHR